MATFIGTSPEMFYAHFFFLPADRASLFFGRKRDDCILIFGGQPLKLFARLVSHRQFDFLQAGHRGDTRMSRHPSGRPPNHGCALCILLRAKRIGLPLRQQNRGWLCHIEQGVRGFRFAQSRLQVP